MELQYDFYARSYFTATIRAKSKKKSLVCPNKLREFYAKIRNRSLNLDCLKFVETLHDHHFVEYVTQSENDSCESDEVDTDFEEISENDSSEESETSEETTIRNSKKLYEIK